MDKQAIARAWLRFDGDPQAFVRECIHIYDATHQDWLPFDLWPAQSLALAAMVENRKLVVLKARQLGISWLCLSYALWLVLLRAPATILLFSLREEEAKELLWRLRGMYERLPPWLRARAVTHSNETRWILSNGSRALAFSTRAGRSYTGTLALVDEADFVPDLSQFLNGVKPTIDAGGQLLLVSTSDKKHPQSTFKNLFRAAQQGAARTAGVHAGGNPGDNLGSGDYRHVFLPWHARPGRDAAWHATVQAEMFAQRGSNDDFYAEYPGSPEDALAAEQLDRRLPLDWLKRCIDGEDKNLNAETQRLCGGHGEKQERRGDQESEASSSSANSAHPPRLCVENFSSPPSLPGLTVWEEPRPGHRYVIGADPAEGNPNSDESAAVVLDAETWGQVAELAGKIEPSTFAQTIDQVGQWYNAAAVLAERNNHGHLLLRELERLGHLPLLAGHDNKPGWLSNIKGKPLLYGLLADAVAAGACTVRSSETAAQLASIEASTLNAPAGLHDDRADAFALAVAALAWKPQADASTVVAQGDPLDAYDRGRW